LWLCLEGLHHRAVPDTADTPILPIFAVTIPDKASALPISYGQIVDDIGETGKEYEIIRKTMMI